MKHLNFRNEITIAEIIDQWSGLAHILAQLIEKYASKLNMDNLASKVAINES